MPEQVVKRRTAGDKSCEIQDWDERGGGCAGYVQEVIVAVPSEDNHGVLLRIKADMI